MSRIYKKGKDHVMYRHGQSVDKISRLYVVWIHMIERCEKRSVRSYPRYGGRGIAVCAEWHDNAIFFEWALAHGYNDSLTIDRIDNNGNYCPENCQFITIRENTMKRPRSPNIGIWFHTNRYEVGLYKRINGVDKHFYGGRFIDKSEAVIARDALYEKIKLL